MSTDEHITKDLVQTLRDGEKGFANAADKLDSSDRAELSAQFRSWSRERASFAEELEQMGAKYGDTIDESGSVTAALHRGWMAVKDAFGGDGAAGVLDAAEQGEDHAKAEYDKALKADISAELRAVVSRQYQQVQLAHDQIKSLRDAAS